MHTQFGVNIPTSFIVGSQCAPVMVQVYLPSVKRLRQVVRQLMLCDNSNQLGDLYFNHTGTFSDLQAPTLAGPPLKNLGAGTSSCTASRKQTTIFNQVK